MTHEANIINYFFQAGLVVKAVMLILLIASIASWTLIFQRAWFFKQKKQQAKDFMERFQNSSDVSKLFLEVEKQKEEKGLPAIFAAGFKAFLRGRKKGQVELEPIERAMMIPYAKDAETLEKHLPFFASVGSIAPYVGLFGTVWGIMTSLQALGHAQQATIAMVAPGISEALVATALGLFTAIPAVIAYNRYTTSLSRLLKSYDLFQEEFVLLIEQQKESNQKVVE